MKNKINREDFKQILEQIYEFDNSINQDYDNNNNNNKNNKRINQKGYLIKKNH